MIGKAGALEKSGKDGGMARWQALLADRGALLSHPGAHHKALLAHANALYREKLIDGDRLSDLLELADGALAFAVESILDIDNDE